MQTHRRYTYIFLVALGALASYLGRALTSLSVLSFPMHYRGQQMAKELIIAQALSSQSNASNGGMEGLACMQQRLAGLWSCIGHMSRHICVVCLCSCLVCASVCGAVFV
jgi:hypothetical protein